MRVKGHVVTEGTSVRGCERSEDTGALGAAAEMAHASNDGVGEATIAHDAECPECRMQASPRSASVFVYM